MALKIIRNDLLKMDVDAIVNPTDYYLSGSGSIDAKIHKIGGPKLKLELSKYGCCEEGNAIFTNSHGLNCSFIIHTAGPLWNESKESFKILNNCYMNSLKLAKYLGVKSIAFPLLASGTLGFPSGKAIQIALNAINSFLINNEMTIYLVVYNSEAFGISKKLISNVQSFIETDNLEDERIKNIQELLGFFTIENPKRNYTRSKPIDKDLFFKQIKIPLCEDTYFEPSINELLPDLNNIKEDENNAFKTKLFKIIDKYNFKDSAVYNAAGISKMVFSNIRKGIIPKKKTILQLCLSLPITLSETTELLESAGYALIPSDKFEKTIKIIIENKNTSQLTSIAAIDLILYELGLPCFNSGN